MSGLTLGARRWALSAGSVMVLGGGLALYQMTSLVLGPAGSRQLHISLTLPAVAVDDPSESPTFSVDHVLGTAVPNAVVAARPAAARRPSGTAAVQPTASAVASAVGATPTTAPLEPVVSKPLKHPSSKPKPYND